LYTILIKSWGVQLKIQTEKKSFFKPCFYVDSFCLIILLCKRRKKRKSRVWFLIKKIDKKNLWRYEILTRICPADWSCWWPACICKYDQSKPSSHLTHPTLKNNNNCDWSIILLTECLPRIIRCVVSLIIIHLFVEMFTSANFFSPIWSHAYMCLLF
jgi:hypothetical protein